MKQEIFKDIHGYEGIYQVSNFGNVKSLSRKVHDNGGYFIRKERILKTDNVKKYLSVRLSLKMKSKRFLVHQLVAMAFLNHKPNGHKIVVDHINNNALDNRPENLQLITQRENASKDRKGGTSKYVGVCCTVKNKKWSANITINNKSKHLGYFKNEYEAHLTYQKELKKIKDEQ